MAESLVAGVGGRRGTACSAHWLQDRTRRLYRRPILLLVTTTRDRLHGESRLLGIDFSRAREIDFSRTCFDSTPALTNHDAGSLGLDSSPPVLAVLLIDSMMT